MSPRREVKLTRFDAPLYDTTDPGQQDPDDLREQWLDDCYLDDDKD